MQTSAAIAHRQEERQRRLAAVFVAIAAVGAFAVVSVLGAAWPSHPAGVSVQLQLSGLRSTASAPSVAAGNPGAIPAVKGIPVVALAVVGLSRSASGTFDASGSATLRVKAGAYLFCANLPETVIPPAGLETLSAGWYCRPGAVLPSRTPLIDLGAATGSGS